MGLNLYLAAAWGRKDEIDALIPLFEEAGHTVVSTWTKEIGKPTQWLDEFSDTSLRLTAERDLLEIEEADVLVLFSNGSGSATMGGGRFFESGYAYACGIPTIVVGDKEIVFHHLPNVFHVPDAVRCAGDPDTDDFTVSPNYDELLWTLDQLELLGSLTQEAAA